MCSLNNIFKHSSTNQALLMLRVSLENWCRQQRGIFPRDSNIFKMFSAKRQIQNVYNICVIFFLIMTINLKLLKNVIADTGVNLWKYYIISIEIISQQSRMLWTWAYGHHAQSAKVGQRDTKLPPGLSLKALELCSLWSTYFSHEIERSL